ncbi:hypothetical protein [Paludisphaera soli]|uniref:hypothetical protein n=1 Tax=Paludisphaera soli TaxID=2712865 RepID=UPI0013EB0E5D|nr:hypothetical protein [Paludisphaera soli]
MNQDADLAALIEGVLFDSGEWIDVPGRSCIRRLKGMGSRAPSAIVAIADLLANHPETVVKHHCVELLVNANMSEADEALAEALRLPLEDEVRQSLIEEADDSVRLRRHARFVANARELERLWSHPSLRTFLGHAADAAGSG